MPGLSLRNLRHSYAGREHKAKSENKHHRRSWHIIGHHGGSKDKERRSTRFYTTKQRSRTWHFPRISRHSRHSSSHHHSHRGHHSSTRHGTLHPTAEEEDHAHAEIIDVSVLNGEERKKFAYSTEAVSNETPTRAPFLPDETAATDENTSDPPSSQDANKQPPPQKKKKSGGIFKRIKRAFAAVEEFIFPGCMPLHHAEATSQRQQRPERVRGGVLMESCLTAAEHKAKCRDTVALAKNLYGERGLRACGFEYRLVSCKKCSKQSCTLLQVSSDPSSLEGVLEFAEDQGDDANADNRGDAEQHLGDPEPRPELQTEGTTTSSEAASDDNHVCDNNYGEKVATKEGTADEGGNTEVSIRQQRRACHDCCTRLFDIESNTQIESFNRKLYIADGDMYDAVARLCQEAAHEIMQQEYGMQWVKVCDVADKEPIRALVNAEHFMAQQEASRDDRATLLIVTGKGKVRAGIFSRQHLLISGVEASTALPLIQEAQQRNLHIVMLDPNVHGDALGMVTFEKSMAKLFGAWETSGGSSNTTIMNRDLYILSHSASGSHLARYLLDKSDHYLPHIRAIAFTDSTHNVQWARQRGLQKLERLLESPACVYFRCCTSNDHAAGEPAPCDQFWKHRFGNVKTCWAGTKEHSLTNWFAHSFIWEHFDRILHQQRRKVESNRNDQDDNEQPEQ